MVPSQSVCLSNFGFSNFASGNVFSEVNSMTVGHYSVLRQQ